MLDWAIFRPVKEDNILEHKMHSEFLSINDTTAEIISKAKKKEKGLLLVGLLLCEF